MGNKPVEEDSPRQTPGPLSKKRPMPAKESEEDKTIESPGPQSPAEPDEKDEEEAVEKPVKEDSPRHTPGPLSKKVKIADFAKKVPVIDKEKIEKIKKAVSGWSMDTPSRDDWTKEPTKEKSKTEASIKDAPKDAPKDASKDAPEDAPETDDIEEIQEIEYES